MGKAVASNSQFRNLVGHLGMMSESFINQIDGTFIQNAIDKCGSGETQAEFVNWINNGCRLNTVLANAFTVGDIFRHRAEKGDHRLWLSDNTQNWLIKPNLKKVITINFDLKKLSEYCLPQNMNDSSIQENTGNPGFMTEEEFFLIMYLLIFQPDIAKQVLGYSLRKDKWYVFHVMVNGKKVAFNVYWDGGEWRLDAYGFDARGWWIQDDIFLFPATKAVA